jgi:protein TonB
MKALPAALLEEHDPREILRWGIAGAVILAAHAALIATYLLLRKPEPMAYGVPVVTVDLAPAPSAPEIAPLDLPPEPEMQQAEQQPEKIEPKVEELPPPPPKPEVVTEVLPPPKPKVEPETKKPPAPKTTPRAAAPAVGRPASTKQFGVQTAEAKSALLQWQQLVYAQLARNKRPMRETGTARVTFTVARNGRVTGQRVSGSSGQSPLDAEALAIVARSQPMPAFFPAMTQNSIAVTIPISFTSR